MEEEEEERHDQSETEIAWVRKNSKIARKILLDTTAAAIKFISSR